MWKELDFDEFTPQLTAFLENHRKQEKIKRALKKTNEASAKKRKDSMENSDNEDDQSQIAEELPSKRQKIDLDESVEMQTSVKATEDNEKEDTGKNGTKEPQNGNNDVNRAPNSVQNHYIILFTNVKYIKFLW